MSVNYGLDKLPADRPECAVAVGVFDGVHWGHRAVFEEVIRAAREREIAACALTFDRHPAELLAPNRAPLYINTLKQRMELILATGVDEVVVAEFSPALANLAREEFAERVLRGALRARQVVVGSNFRFGRNREGDIRYLSEAAPALGMCVSVVPAVIVNDGPVNSTRIRALLERGDVVTAAKLLGRRFALRGVVIQGRQIGRTLGFPTANIQTGPRQLVPARGVYVVESTVGGSTYAGVCNIGRRPTFDTGEQCVEVHLTGFSGNIYGETIDVGFCRRLRDEMVFESPERLAEQIKRDLERALGGCAER